MIVFCSCMWWKFGIFVCIVWNSFYTPFVKIDECDRAEPTDVELFFSTYDQESLTTFSLSLINLEAERDLNIRHFDTMISVHRNNQVFVLLGPPIFVSSIIFSFLLQPTFLNSHSSDWAEAPKPTDIKIKFYAISPQNRPQCKPPHRHEKIFGIFLAFVFR